MVSHDSLAARRGSLSFSGKHCAPPPRAGGTWQLAVCSGNVLFLNAVTAFQPRVQWQCQTAEDLLSRLATHPLRSLLLVATDDLLDLALYELLPLLRAQVRPARLQVVLFLEDQLDQGRLRGLMAAGAQVLCRLRLFQGQMLASAINNALLNHTWLDPLYADQLRPDGAWRQRRALQPWNLPGREWEMLRQVGQGYNALEISERLGIRSDTVRRTLSRLYRRIGVRDRAQAVGWCFCHGLISRQDLKRRYPLSADPQEQP
jgi:DNA-binding NarL/FixJ family response regulator